MDSLRQISEFQKQMGQSFALSNHFRKQISDAQMFSRQFREHAAGVRAITDSLHRQTGAAQAFANSMKLHFDASELIASISRMHGPNKQLKELIQGLDSSRQILDSLRVSSVASQVQAIQGQIFQLPTESFGKDLMAQMAASFPTVEAINLANESLNKIWVQFQDIELHDSLENEDKEEATAVAQSLVTDVSAGLTAQDYAEKIITAIQTQKNPSVQLWLWLMFMRVIRFLMLTAITTAVTVIMTPSMEELIGQSPQETKKNIRKHAHEAVDVAEVLVNYRFVKAKTLAIRENPKSTSRVITRLSLGSTVELIRKERDFALVAWKGRDSEAEIQGWVFARHLAKF